MMTRVSIGLPVYNGENYLEAAIESVLGQTYEDWELVISDNASEDGTQAICEAYALRDSRIRYFRADQNHGAAWNFNETFHRSQGEFFRWLSHDDYLMPEIIEKCVAVLEAHPNVISCATRTGALDSEGYRILDDVEGGCDLRCQGLTEESERLRLKYSASPRPSDRYRGILLYSRRCNEVYGLIRRQDFAKTQLHPTYCGGDKVLLAEIALRGPIYEIDELLFFMRWHTERFTESDSTQEQQEHMATNRKRILKLPHQYYSALGYLDLIQRVKMPLYERLRCFGVWIRFLLQVSKWGEILKNTLLMRSTSAKLEGQTRRGERIHGFGDPQKLVGAEVSLEHNCEAT